MSMKNSRISPALLLHVEWMLFVGTQEGISCALVVITIFLEEIPTKDVMNALMIVIAITGKFMLQFNQFPLVMIS